MALELKKDAAYSLLVATSMGVRLTPVDGQPFHCGTNFQMQVTSAETNVASVASYLGLKTKVLTAFVKDSPVARMIKDNLASRHMDYEGPEFEQGNPWGFRHQFNLADSGYGSRGPRVQNDRAGEVGSKDTASFIASGVYTTDRNGLELYSTHFSTRCVTHHTLNLTIAEVRNGVNPNPRYDTVCDKYTISFNGSRYEFTESTDSLLVSKIHEDVNLCYDTSMMVHIVVNHKSYADSHDTVCDSYYWPFTQQTYTASTVQTYVLPGTRNSVGCDSVGRLYLTVNHTPVVSIEGNWHLHPSTGNVAHLTIVDNPADNNTYKWFKNNETTPFSTEKTISETVSENTDIHLETTSDKGCTANNWITITYTVGIDEADDINVNLYPNPASRYLNVESSEGISEVIVYNAIGQQVIRRDVNATATQLDLGALAVGNYTLQIRSLNGEQTTRKFIVNK